MTLESDLKSDFVRQSVALGAYARRIEDRFAVGVLDIIVIYPGYRTFFIEGKIIRGLRLQPTERQWIEGQRIYQAGATPVLIGWDEHGNFFISKWTKFATTINLHKREGTEYGRYFQEWVERTQPKFG